MKKSIYIWTIAIFVLISCKKDKLTGDAKALSGTWQWANTAGEFSTLTPGNTGTTKTLEFIDKGKYEIKKDGKKLEGGRIIYSEVTNSNSTYFKIEFLRNTLFSNKREFPGKSLLRIIDVDTLYIGEDASDAACHLYVRQK